MRQLGMTWSISQKLPDNFIVKDDRERLGRSVDAVTRQGHAMALGENPAGDDCFEMFAGGVVGIVSRTWCVIDAQQLFFARSCRQPRTGQR